MKKADERSEETSEYAEGFRAARSGCDKSACPYPIGTWPERTNWFVGWYDAKYSRKDEPSFARAGRCGLK